jgi:hypothetical protein
VSITDSYTAVTALLNSNATLTALLGTYSGTAIPLIIGGVLAEQETGLPKIIFTNSGSEKTNFLSDDTFTLNCVAATQRESYLIAKTVRDEFHQKQNPIHGYFTQTLCRIIGSIPDPTESEVNTPVEFGLINM